LPRIFSNQSNNQKEQKPNATERLED